MPEIEIAYTSNDRPDEDDVCRALRRMNPWGPAQTTPPMPQIVLAKVLPLYQQARETFEAPRAQRRAAFKAWTSAIETIVRKIRSGAITWA